MSSETITYTPTMDLRFIRRKLRGGMTTGERIEANANLTLWCVHILGSDDVMAAPSHDAAVIHAHELNKALHSRLTTANDVLCFAYAAPWPHSKAAHADDVKNWLKVD